MRTGKTHWSCAARPNFTQDGHAHHGKTERHALAVAWRHDGHATEARSGDAREEVIKGRKRGAGRASVRRPEAALGGLLRGLCAGDLEAVLLTVAMAADENRMPSADPDEEKRILAFLTRLAEHDAALPPPDCA